MEKRYFGVFLGVVILVLGMSATISYIGDPAGIFGHDTYEKEMVDILQSGHNVINNENMDWGRFRSNLIARGYIKPNTVVLGSSRVMEISDEMLDPLPLPKNRVFFNSWTASATLGDMISMVMCYAEKGEIPRTIILGLDPSSFYKEGLFVPSLAKYYSIGLEKMGHSQPVQDKWTILDKKYFELISYPHLIAAIGKIRRRNHHPTPTENSYGEDSIDLQDGRRSWPKSYREKTAAEVESDIRTSQLIIQGPPSKMNPNQMKIFDAFNGYLHKNGVRVVFFLAPWHPLIYENITVDPNIYKRFTVNPGHRVLVESEAYIRKYAKEKNIPVVGSFDPARFSLTSSDFYDGCHPRPDAVSRIFASDNASKRN